MSQPTPPLPSKSKSINNQLRKSISTEYTKPANLADDTPMPVLEKSTGKGPPPKWPIWSNGSKTTPLSKSSNPTLWPNPNGPAKFRLCHDRLNPCPAARNRPILSLRLNPSHRSSRISTSSRCQRTAPSRWPWPLYLPVQNVSFLFCCFYPSNFVCLYWRWTRTGRAVCCWVLWSDPRGKVLENRPAMAACHLKRPSKSGSDDTRSGRARHSWTRRTFHICWTLGHRHQSHSSHGSSVRSNGQSSGGSTCLSQ